MTFRSAPQHPLGDHTVAVVVSNPLASGRVTSHMAQQQPIPSQENFQLFLLYKCVSKLPLLWNLNVAINSFDIKMFSKVVQHLEGLWISLIIVSGKELVHFTPFIFSRYVRCLFLLIFFSSALETTLV